jgi:hypothetical protein
MESLEANLDVNLRILEERWGRDIRDALPSTRFFGLIRRVCESFGGKVVVLVDEYDKPLLETMEDPELNEEIRRELKGFYGILKAADPWLGFVFLTGVTRFSQVSVFSDLDQLRDISLLRGYVDIRGITEEELRENFDPELHSLAEENDLSFGEALDKMRKYYNGYHFCEQNTLGFPNEEVEYGFLNALLPYYGPRPEEQDFFAGNFYADLRGGNTDAFMVRLRAFFSSIPYDLHERTERYYQTVFYLVFRLLGRFAWAEMRSGAGRSDAVSLGIPKDEVPRLELKAMVYNVNCGHNEEIAARCGKLRGYSVFIGKMRELERGDLRRKEAMEEAVKWCIANNILREFFENHGSEVVNMLLTE